MLELAYAPLTAFEFSLLKNDKKIEHALETASLYIIAQRPVITFENIQNNSCDYSMNFEIHQKNQNTVLKGKIPLIQNVVGSRIGDEIIVAFNFLDKSKIQKSPPFNNVHGFSFAKNGENGYEPLTWFSPEKLLQNWWKGNIDCEVFGDFRHFLRYKVHYVGKATKQSILKRLNGHSTFQDILSRETPVTEKQIPANEIVILFIKFKDNLQIMTYGKHSDTTSLAPAIMGEYYPEEEKVFLDVEKALINAIKPLYNKEMFKSYPKSKDGLYHDNYNAVSYSFVDPITLTYEEGEIVGGLSQTGGDSIQISENKNMRLVKHKI